MTPGGQEWRRDKAWSAQHVVFVRSQETGFKMRSGFRYRAEVSTRTWSVQAFPQAMTSSNGLIPLCGGVREAVRRLHRARIFYWPECFRGGTARGRHVNGAFVFPTCSGGCAWLISS